MSQHVIWNYFLFSFSCPEISTDTLYRAIAKYSFKAHNDDQLSLEAGQIVEILVEHENGWWLGRVNGMEGFVPSNYVKKLDIEG